MTEVILDYVIEAMFIADFFMRFFQEFKEEESYTTISDVKKIVIHYLKGSCIFDFLAILPFNMFFEIEETRFYRLFKLLRVPRLFGLLNVTRIK